MSDLVQSTTEGMMEERGDHPVTENAFSVRPVEYDFDGKGNIVLPDRAPFDGNSVLIKIGAGWCEAWWDDGRKTETVEGTDYEGFQWVCMDADFTAELDDAKFWCALPKEPAHV